MACTLDEATAAAVDGEVWLIVPSAEEVQATTKTNTKHMKLAGVRQSSAASAKSRDNLWHVGLYWVRLGSAHFEQNGGTVSKCSLHGYAHAAAL